MTRVEETFREWTRGKSLTEARISVFEHIRDIPYAIIPELRDPRVGTEKILEIQKGGCQPKHYLLGLYFGKLGISVKYVTYEFLWEDSAGRYPVDLKEMIKGLPPAYHLAVKAEIEHATQEERYAYEMGKRALMPEKDKALYSAFIPRFNEWVAPERKRNPGT